MLKQHVTASLAALGLLCSHAALADKYALLVGVGDYAEINDLRGPPNDVENFASILTRHWGVPRGNIVSLVNSQATRDKILHELDRLYTKSKPGDAIMFYFSGHGSSAYDSNTSTPIPTDSGIIFPYDTSTSGNARQMANSIIIGRRDLLPRLKKLDQGQRQLFAAFDACYSGTSIRSLGNDDSQKKHYNLFKHATRSTQADINQLISKVGRPTNTARQTPFPYKNLAYIGASSRYEVALDSGGSRTIDGRPGGVFTNALFRVLRGDINGDINRDGKLSYAELFAVTKAYMRHTRVPHTPQLLPIATDPAYGATQHTIFSQKVIPVASHTPVTKRSLGISASDRVKGWLSGMPGIHFSHVNYALHITGDTDSQLSLHTSDKVIFGRIPNNRNALIQAIGREQWRRSLVKTLKNTNRFGMYTAWGPFGVGDVIQLGDVVSFTSRAERDARLLVLSIHSNGNISKLYPWTEAERAIKPANSQVKLLNNIKAAPPVGINTIVTVAYTGDAVEFTQNQWNELPYGSEKWKQLMKWLTTASNIQPQVTELYIQDKTNTHP